MDLQEFVDSKRAGWQQLEALLNQAERTGIKKLILGDVQQLSKLYRRASSDLLWVRSRAGSAEVSGYLNDLVGRAYALTYPTPTPRVRDAVRFVTHGFPETLHREWQVVALSGLLFLGGSIFGFLGMVVDPKAAPYLVPAEHMSLDPVQRAEKEAANDGAQVDEQVAFASFLFTHNIQVAFLAFASGLTAGIGTALLLFGNGLMLGALAAVYTSKAMTGWFWAWILPHGIPEITAICIAGAGGLVLARGLIAPQGLSRREALKREGKTAVRLLLGTLLLFVFAGLIEGTISQIHPPRLSVGFKLSFAMMVGLGLVAYLGSGWLGQRNKTKV